MKVTDANERANKGYDDKKELPVVTKTCNVLW